MIVAVDIILVLALIATMLHRYRLVRWAWKSPRLWEQPGLYLHVGRRNRLVRIIPTPRRHHR
jgi:hypothetical protein